MASFRLTGAPATFTVPAGVGYVQALLLGAAGGAGSAGAPSDFGRAPAPGGPGGRASAILGVAPGATLTVRVGGAGGSVDDANPNAPPGAGGYNGGGRGGSNPFSGGSLNRSHSSGGGGGGATDLRSGGDSLADRVLVAGGGGGSGAGPFFDCGGGAGGAGGAGGGSAGAGGGSTAAAGGAGGDQAAGGAGGSGAGGAMPGGAGGLGSGGEGALDPTGDTGAGGGGGGLYGGGAGQEAASCSVGGAGGGGGSGFAAPSLLSASLTGSAASANPALPDGYATLTYTEPYPSATAPADRSASPAAPVTLEATVSADPAAVSVDGGTVQFLLDGRPVGAPVAVSGGRATLVTTAPAAVGTLDVAAAFSGATAPATTPLAAGVLGSSGRATLRVVAPAPVVTVTPLGPCRSSRRFVVHLQMPDRVRLRHARITLGGRLLANLRGRRRSVVIDLRGRPRGTVVVSIVAVQGRGRRVTGRRVYHPCVPYTLPGHKWLPI